MTPNETLVRIEMLMAASQAHFVAWCNSKTGNIENVFESGLAFASLNPEALKSLDNQNITVDPSVDKGALTYCDDLRLEAYFDEAIALVRTLKTAIAPEEAAPWMAWMTRWLYGCEHRLAQIQPGLGTSAKEWALREWRRWARRQYRNRLGLSQDPADHPAPTGPAELLELALFEGPLREAAISPQWRVAWAASALQEQNLLLFKAFSPDRALMNDILAVARPLVREDWSDYCDDDERFLSDEIWKDHAQRTHTDPQAADFLWLEWVHSPRVKPATLLAMFEAGIHPYETTTEDHSWLTLARTREDFDVLVKHIDPLDANLPFCVRLNAFQSLGPVAVEWESHITLDLGAGREVDWLLPYAKQRWLTWTLEEQTLAVECWQAQVLSGITQSGFVCQRNSNKGYGSALQAIELWQGNKVAADQQEQLALAFMHEHKPLPRWVFDDGAVATFSGGACWLALNHMTEQQAKGLDARFVIRPTDEPALHVGKGCQAPDDLWRFLFALATTTNFGAFMRYPMPGVEGGVFLGEMLHRWMRKADDTAENTKLFDEAALNLLPLRARNSDTLTAEGWQGLSPYLPEIAACLLKRQKCSLSYMRHWVGEAPPEDPQEAILQAHALLRLLALHGKDAGWALLPLDSNLFVQRLQALWLLYPQLGPHDPNASVQGVWEKAVAAYPLLESAWRSAHLSRVFTPCDTEEVQCVRVRF